MLQQEYRSRPVTVTGAEVEVGGIVMAAYWSTRARLGSPRDPITYPGASPANPVRKDQRPCSTRAIWPTPCHATPMPTPSP
jgi:hypothetical protein